jgi:protocatechuate 3,4-dioxygenase beta subunit
LLVASVVVMTVSACNGDNGAPSVATQTPTSAGVAVSPPTNSSESCAAQDGPVAESATLTMGPAPGLPATTVVPQPLEIVGAVYNEACAPVEGASLRVWQTDSDGVYGPGHGTDSLQCCYLQGTVTTDADGRFKLLTTMPGHYQGEDPPPPAHIHVEARHRSGLGARTEIVFADDPYLPQPAGDGYVVVTLTGDPGELRRGIATIVLTS